MSSLFCFCVFNKLFLGVITFNTFPPLEDRSLGQVISFITLTLSLTHVGI